MAPASGGARFRFADLELWLPAGPAAPLAAEIEARLAAWDRDECSRRLWGRDPSLWTGRDESRWMGWLEPGAGCEGAAYEAWCSHVATAEWSSVVLLGMGGSSLGAQLLCEGVGKTGRRLRVLDTTDPEEIGEVADGLDLARTLFVVASKSGSTIETVSLEGFFWERVRAVCGAAAPGAFLAVTDPATELDRRAAERGYHRLQGAADVGGRFSVLTPFGLAVAVAMGVDGGALLEGARSAAEGLRAGGPARDDPAVALGAILGVLAASGYGEPVLRPPADTATLADWIEQLLAESTGKDGRGILPIAAESRPAPTRARVEWSADGGGGAPPTGPVVRLSWAGRTPAALGREIFRWELATAVAASTLGVHPFVQPDVESAKAATRELLATGELPARWTEEGGAADRLRRFVGEPGPVRYVAVLAYLPRSAAVRAAVSSFRDALAAATGLPAVVGFGPRYLHSTGQLFKGGPAGGFVFLTRSRPAELAIPGEPIGFGGLQTAQALGDARVLREAGRAVVHLELADDPVAELDRLGGLLR